MASILIVCTANICRSPYAEALLAEHISQAGRSGLTIHSAGTRASNGQSLCPGAFAMLGQAGIRRDVEPSHRSRKLELAFVRDADLILTASIEHRSEITRTDPTARRRTFTLKEAAAYLGKLASAAEPAERESGVSVSLIEIAEKMNRLRGTVAIPPLMHRSLLRPRESGTQKRLDITDGHLRGYLHHKASLHEVRKAIHDIRLGLTVLGAH